MGTIPLPSDFSEFLKLLNKNEVRYLLVGAYAVDNAINHRRAVTPSA